MVVGTTKAGKTFFCCRLAKQLLQDPTYPRNHLVIISPNYSMDDKLQALAQHAAKIGCVVRVYTTFDKITMQKFVEYMNKSKLEGKKSVVYIDDPVGVGSFTSNINVKSPFNSFVTSAKHYESDIIFSTQAVASMSKSARKCIEVFIFFPDMISRHELFEACRFVPSFEDFDKLMNAYATERYSALWVNVQFGRKGVYRISPNGNISSITGVPS